MTVNAEFQKAAANAPQAMRDVAEKGAAQVKENLEKMTAAAGEAIFGLQKIASLQKPPGFAPDPNAPEPPPPPAPPADAPAGAPGRGRGPTINTGSVNSDLAFSGKNLLVLEAAAKGLWVDATFAGALIRLAPDGTRTVLASAGLVAPTGLAVGQGSIYISNYGFFSGKGPGPHGEVVSLPTS